MKTAFAIALAALGLAQLFAGEEREPAPRMAAPHLPATSYPQVELRPHVAPEPRVASEPGVEPAPKRDESRREPERETATEKRRAERPQTTEERGGQTQIRSVEEPRQQQETTQQRLNFAQARERMPREQHDRAWWDQRYKNIVRAGTGYYFLDAGYWYPAFGYDPEANTYAYDGPIYATADLTPDQEIATVQTTLKAVDYYSGSITGVLDTTTLAAITRFQTANGLLVSGAIDQPTLEVLGLF